MSRRFQLPTGPDLAIVEQLFDTISTLDALAGDTAEATTPDRVPFRRLYAYAVDPHAAADLDVERALRDDAAVRAAFDRLLSKVATPILAAAAATDETFSRVGAGYRLRLESSRAEPSQTYVIIETVDEGVASPRVLLVRHADGRCRKIALPAAHEGVIQLLEADDSDFVRALRDSDNEVFLCRGDDQSLSGDDSGAGSD